jgi:predicted MPP superfamily phosphohydrolase
MRRSLVRLIFLTALLHGYIGWRLLPDLDLNAWGLALGIGFLLMSTVLTPLGVLSRWIKPQRLADRVAWAGLLAMGLYSSLLVLTVLRDVVLLAATLIALVEPAWRGIIELGHISAVVVPIMAFGLTLVGFANARRRAPVVDVDIPIAGLPAALQGFRIAQISDIHIGPTIKKPYLSRIVDAVNALDADLVAITGDLVDGTVGQLADQTAPLARLVSRHGTYFVTGNHEYYSGASEWTEELRRLGLCVLLNQHVVLDHGGTPLVVAGVTDYSAHHYDPAQRSDPGAALAGAPSDAKVRLLLAHQPRSAPAAEKAGFDLQLSGHTHGGQFFPWTFFVRLQQPFTAGLHRLGRLWVYTSRGTGYWGPPKRLCAPSEITHLRLVAAAT